MNKKKICPNCGTGRIDPECPICNDLKLPACPKCGKTVEKVKQRWLPVWFYSCWDCGEEYDIGKNGELLV